MLSSDRRILSAWALLTADRSCNCFLSCPLTSFAAVNCWLTSLFCSCRVDRSLLRRPLSSWQAFSVRIDWVYRESDRWTCCSEALNFPAETQPAEDSAAEAKKRR